jgi:hypothetical protein
MARLGVPEQVISLRSANQAPLRSMGFAPGIVPPYKSPFGGMQDFPPKSLAAFSAEWPAIASNYPCSCAIDIFIYVTKVSKI